VCGSICSPSCAYQLCLTEPGSCISTLLNRTRVMFILNRTRVMFIFCRYHNCASTPKVKHNFSDFSRANVKFPDISRFPRWVASLNKWIGGRGVHGPKFPGPAWPSPLALWPGPLIQLICKARPVQARSLAGPAWPGHFLRRHYDDCKFAMHYANLNSLIQTNSSLPQCAQILSSCPVQCRVQTDSISKLRSLGLVTA